MIEQFGSDVPIKRLCSLFSMSVNSYYRQRRTQDQRGDDTALAKEIHTIFLNSRSCYGIRRVTAMLHRQGYIVNHKRVERLMRSLGLRARQWRKKHGGTTDSNHTQSVAANLVKRQFQVDVPDRVWFTDTTYVATREGWLYLTCVMDACSKRIVGWSTSRRNDRFMVHRALKAALEWRKPAEGLIVHSDRGSTFASKLVCDLLTSWKAVRSMSRRADCYDNAVIESFFATLKREGAFRRGVNKAYDTTRSDIFQYIVLFYNRTRIHSTLGYRSPKEFEEQLDQA